jgi:hypothetical protein
MSNLVLRDAIAASDLALEAQAIRGQQKKACS